MVMEIYIGFFGEGITSKADVVHFTVYMWNSFFNTYLPALS